MTPEQIQRLDELAKGAAPKSGRWAGMPEQHESTKQNMARKDNEPRDWLAPIEGWKAERDAEKVFREVNKASVDDVSHAYSVRKSVKNEEHQSMKSSVSPEKREAAIHHFEVSPSVKGADVPEQDRGRIAGLVEIKSAPIVEEWKKLTPWQAFVHWLKGGKVKADNE